MAVFAGPIGSTPQEAGRFVDLAINETASMPDGWETNGVLWNSEGCGQAHIRRCVSGDCTAVGDDLCEADDCEPCQSAFPFDIYTHRKNCEASDIPSDTEAQAVAELERATSHELSKMLVRGPHATPQDCDGSLRFATSLSTDALAPAAGLGVLLRARSVAGHEGSWFSIPTAIAPSFHQTGLLNYRDGRLWVMDTYPALLVGSGEPPEGATAVAGANFVFAHGPVGYALGPIRTHPYHNLSNVRAVVATRRALVRVDGCGQYAVPVSACCEC